MSTKNRLVRLEKARPKTFVDDGRDGFYDALLGNRLENFRLDYYDEKAGWDLIGCLDAIAVDDWDDYDG